MLHMVVVLMVAVMASRHTYHHQHHQQQQQQRTNNSSSIATRVQRCATTRIVEVDLMATNTLPLGVVSGCCC